MRDILVEPLYGAQQPPRVTRARAKKTSPPPRPPPRQTSSPSRSPHRKTSPPGGKVKTQEEEPSSYLPLALGYVTPNRPAPPASPPVGSPIGVVPKSPATLTPSVYDRETEQIQGKSTFESYKIPIFQYMKFADVLSMFGDKFWEARRLKEDNREYIPMKRVYFLKKDTDALDADTTSPLTTHVTANSGGGFLSYHYKTGGGHYLFYTFERSTSDEPLTVTVYDPNGRASIIENEIQVKLKFEYTITEYDYSDLLDAQQAFQNANRAVENAEAELVDIESSIVRPTANVARDLESDNSPTDPVVVPPASDRKGRKLWTEYKRITKEEMQKNKELDGEKEKLLRNLPRLRAARTRASNTVERYKSERKIHLETTSDTLCSFTERLVRRITNKISEMTIKEGKGETETKIAINVATDRAIREITYHENTASATIRCQPRSIPDNYRGYRDSWMHYVVHNLSHHLTHDADVERIVNEQYNEDGKAKDTTVHLIGLPTTTHELCVTRNFNHSTSLACDYFFKDCEVIFQSVPNLNMSVNETTTSGASQLLQFWFRTRSDAYDSHLYISGMCACIACLYFMNWVTTSKGVDASGIVHEHRLLHLSKHDGEILVLLTAIRKIVESLINIDTDLRLRRLMTKHYTSERVDKDIAKRMAAYNESIKLGTYDTYKCKFTLQSTEASHTLSMDGVSDPVFNAKSLKNRRSSVGFANKPPHVQFVMC